MFELFMYVYSCNALSARFFAVDRALMTKLLLLYYDYYGLRPLDLPCFYLTTHTPYMSKAEELLSS